MNSTRSNCRKLLLAGAALTALWAAPALAQQAGDAANGAEAQTDDQAALAADVVVTATRRETLLQDTPIAVTALTADTLEKMSTNNLNDLALSVPNITVQQQQHGTVMTIRGVRSSVNNPGFSSGVGIYVDDVFLGNGYDGPLGGSLPVWDYERVEFLRGPQGALFGRNTIQGALNITTRRPTFDTEGYIDALAASYRRYSLRAGISGGLVGDKLAGKIAAVAYGDDGTFVNPVSGFRQGSQYGFGARGQLLWKAAPGVEMLVSADGMDQDCPNQSRELVNHPTLSDANPRDRRVSQDTESICKRQNWGLSNRLAIDAGGINITSITAYRNLHGLFFEDQDFTTLDIANLGRDERYRILSQEFRFNGEIGERINWLVGLYYFDSKLNTQTNAEIGPDLAVVMGQPRPTFKTRSQMIGNLWVKSYGIFGSVDIRPFDGLTLGVGGRYTMERMKVNALQDQFGPSFAPILFPDVPFAQDRLNENDFSPTATLTYEATGDLTLYARYASGFRAGGFNLQPGYNPTTWKFLSERVNSYEAGIKAALFDRALAVNLTAFYLDYRNLQLQTSVGAVFAVGNAAQASSRGVEFEVNGRIARWLNLSASLGYADAHFDNYPNPARNIANFNGNRLPNAPRWNGSIAPEFMAEAGKYELFFRPEAQFQTKQFSNAANNPLTLQDSFALVNFRAGVRVDNRWTLSVFGENLFDKIVTPSIVLPAFIGGLTGAPQSYEVSYNEPRKLGVELSYKF